MKKICTIMFSFLLVFCAKTVVNAQNISYTVKSGDSMWKIAVRYQIGVSEIISANPQIKNPSLIYPGQKLSIPNIDDIKKLENEVIRLVNVERSKYGLKPLAANWELSRVARYKSQDMKNKNYFSHQSPTYGSPFQMMQHFGIVYRTAGENIAMGQRTPQEVMTAWMNSPGHRANILKAEYTEIGVGVAKDGSIYWTQMFIAK
ncbi:SafA/ExsA family spore coat assembly protein [Clostridium sp. SYSU_GA19001]|uniref:SafA/ExsA family spore coat assembly protein n=1 Tax=Clostridium caldaquaticum TaxID=2940653 RepID=UPI002076F78D|nr:SafA/ExsA family spore coat assembly protein [Clostridium caldaquaticum]MCM8711722.1 SafA/ExsA family spore coat assembly protein [Clostridium caldaquaticum]